MSKHSVSAVIPSYNGKSLLKENLPAVEKILSVGDELIIVDDGSSDDTLEFLKKKYELNIVKDLKDKYGDFKVYISNLAADKSQRKFSVKLILNPLNLRFAASCNRGVLQAQNELILLLNNDVFPLKDLLANLRFYFNDSKVFAVGCLEKEPNKDNLKGGKNKLWFEKGLFQHSRADDFSQGETAWASGGSAIFSKQKWLELNGFDEDYYPAYWEDIDLSYRAKQKGWQVLFEPKAKVIHNHETTNQTVFGRTLLQKLSWKHAHRFVFKNGTLKQKLLNAAYRPYWCWQRLKTQIKNPLVWAGWGVLLLAAFLRFYKLGLVPHGMTWDEAAIGYNGHAVIQTRRDEWLERLPISFKSFDDYKAPAAIYINGIFTNLLDLNLQVVRLPFAIAGVLTVWGMIKLTQEILRYTNYKSTIPPQVIGLISGLIMALSPWHLHFSRAGFESGLALCFIVWGLWYGLRYLKKMHVVSLKLQLKLLLPAICLITASLYTYHSAKLFIPLLAVVLFFNSWSKIKHNFLSPIIGLAAAALLSLPLVYDSFFGQGLSRAGTLIFSIADSLGSFSSLLFQRITAHLSPQFLILGWTDTLRHGTGTWGVLLPTTYLLAIIGVIILSAKLIAGKKTAGWGVLSVLLTALGLMPAILGQEMPQANRALLALPGFIFLAVFGLDQLLDLLKKIFKQRLKPAVIIILLGVIHFVFFGFYLNYYYTEFAAQSAADFQDGYIEAFSIARQYEKGLGQKPEVNQIVFSNHYGQAYIYALFVRKTNPIWYQGGSLIKYLFVDNVKSSDLSKDNSLIVASRKDQLPVEKADHVVYGSDGEIRFKIYYTGDNN